MSAGTKPGSPENVGAVNLGGLPDDTRFECRICWHVYDPAEGDPVWQIAPGTPFADLPPHWSCPNCTAEKSGFLPIRD
jgi:rubredoxin